MSLLRLKKSSRRTSIHGSASKRAGPVEVRWLSIFDGLDRIDVACKGARMLAISYVQYLSGYA